MTNRIRFRSRARTMDGTLYDADAQAYIAATGALFPDAVNALVVGLKAAGLWDNHLGSLKFAIGVPSLAASMIDLRNPAFNGTAVNSPTHSATEGWTFAGTSSQYIDTGWQGPASDSKAALNSVHVGARLRAVSGTGGGLCSSYHPTPAERYCGLLLWQNGNQQVCFHAGNPGIYQLTQNPALAGAYIGTRTASNACALYVDGVSGATSSVASVATVPVNVVIGALNNNGIPGAFLTGRVSAWHAGAGLDASQAAALNALLNAYATACGET